MIREQVHVTSDFVLFRDTVDRSSKYGYRLFAPLVCVPGFLSENAAKEAAHKAFASIQQSSAGRGK